MSGFLKYPHLERLGGVETDGILIGDVVAFYKIDGTNGSIWWDKDRLHFGSRNRELGLGSDNAGFMNALYQDEKLKAFFSGWKDVILYGEWLVPHSLKTYRDDAWHRFYIFDVYHKVEDRFLSYDEYKPVLDFFGLTYIPPIAVMRNPTVEQCLSLLEKTGQFLIKDGMGIGEGVVFKNYIYTNKFGRTTWAKLVANEFKEIHHRGMGAPLILGSKLIEEEIVEGFVTEAFVLKEQAKISLQYEGGFTNRNIPELLGRVFYELIREEMFNILRKHKNPKIDFGLLNKFTIQKTKNIIGL